MYNLTYLLTYLLTHLHNRGPCDLITCKLIAHKYVSIVCNVKMYAQKLNLFQKD